MELPTIHTARLRIVRPSLDHAPGMFEYGRRPDFVRHLSGVPQNTVKEAEDFLQFLIGENVANCRMYWSALFNNRIVGTLGFIFHGLLVYRESEFGYGFSPEVWGKGIAHEAATAVLDWGHANLKIGRYRFYTRASNASAIGGMERLGFERDWVIRAFYPDGEDCVVLRRAMPG